MKKSIKQQLLESMEEIHTDYEFIIHGCDGASEKIESIADNMAIAFHVYLKRKTDAGEVLSLTYAQLLEKFKIETYGK